MAITSTTLTADGDTPDHEYKAVSGSTQGIEGFQFHADGSFGGGTLTLSFLAADDTFHDLAEGIFTANADKDVRLLSPTTVKATLAGATAPTIFIQFTDFARG